MTQEWKTVEKLLTPEQLDGKCKLFARVTIQPGHELASHQHIGETETYYILSGKGIYDDDGTKIPAEANECFFCDDGHSHGIVCTSVEPLVFLALIINK